MDELCARVEAVLFVTGDAVKLAKLAKILTVTADELELVLAHYAQSEHTNRGIVMVRNNGTVQLVTAPAQTEFVEAMVAGDIAEDLGRAALEVLAIVAYRGPIARMDIDAIRGVNCASSLRSLMVRGLIERATHPTDSRSYLYRVTSDFVSHLGLTSIADLPEFETLRTSTKIATVVSPQSELADSIDKE